METTRTLLVIDGNRDDHHLIMQAVPEWRVLVAATSLEGVELARAYGAILDLVIIDMDPGAVDGYWTCLQLRAMFPALRILPTTTRYAALRLLDELGCAHAIHKPASVTTIRERIDAALHGSPVAQDDARCIHGPRPPGRPDATRARMLAAAAGTVLIAAQDQVIAQGLHQIVAQVWPGQTGPLTQDALDAGHASLVAIVTGARMVADIRAWIACPLVVTVGSLIDGLGLYEVVKATGGGIVLTNQPLDQVIWEMDCALKAAQQGINFIPAYLEAVWRKAGMTRRESEYLLLSCQDYTVEAIARAMQVDVRSVRQYRRRVREKLGVRVREEKDNDYA